MQIKTSELTGAALDWAVAKALGYVPAKREKRSWGYATVPAPEKDFSYLLTRGDEGVSFYLRGFSPAEDWAQSGPIIEREKIKIDPRKGNWEATIWNEAATQNPAYGPTPLIAAMRCYVSSKLGDEIEIPKELLA